MVLIVPEEVIQRAVSGVERQGALFGTRIDGGDVVRVQSLTPNSDTYLGSWRIDSKPPTSRADAGSPSPESEIFLLIDDQAQPRVSGYCYLDGQWHTVDTDIIRLHADFTSRLSGLFEVDRLAGACIAIVGLGSGGSVIAAQLARCGVGHLRLVDFDRLKVHNIIRHACGLRDIGRYKTRAVRDLLHETSPLIQVETYEFDVRARPKQLDQVIAGCDLVIAATDNEASKLAINRACWAHSVPAVYAAAYNRAFGGDIFRAIPPDGACYDCFSNMVVDFFAPPPGATTDLSPGYADPNRMADLIAEPGLAADIGIIAMLTIRVALDVLFRAEAHFTSALPADLNWVLFGNRAEWIFEKPLESMFIHVPKQDDCPTCNYESYVRRHLGVSAATVATDAHALLAQIPLAKRPGGDESPGGDVV